MQYSPYNQMCCTCLWVTYHWFVNISIHKYGLLSFLKLYTDNPLHVSQLNYKISWLGAILVLAEFRFAYVHTNFRLLTSFCGRGVYCVL